MSTPEPQPLPHDQRDPLPPLSEAVIGTLFERVAADTVGRAPTWRDRLRELPTPARGALAVGAVGTACILFLGLEGVRDDLTADEIVRFAALSTVTTLAGVGASSLALRGLHQRPVAGVGAMAAALLAFPLLLSVVPGLWPGDARSVGVAMHLGCGAGGLVAALMTAGIVWAFERSDHPSPWRLGMAAAAGGLFGFVVQGAHCPMVDPAHLALGHGSVGLVLGALLALWNRLRA